jgi:hypothetical protein
MVKKASISEKLPESRFSERVYNQMMENYGVVKPQGKKRSISGTNLNAQNSFAVLSFDNISCLASDMGVDISSMGFDTVDIMKDLELARHALDKSKKSPMSNPNSEMPSDELAPSADVPGVA